MYIPFLDWFWTKRNSIWFKITRRMVYTIWFRLVYQESEVDFPVCTCIKNTIFCVDKLRKYFLDKLHRVIYELKKKYSLKGKGRPRILWIFSYVGVSTTIRRSGGGGCTGVQLRHPNTPVYNRNMVSRGLREMQTSRTTEDKILVWPSDHVMWNFVCQSYISCFQFSIVHAFLKILKRKKLLSKNKFP